MLPNQINLSVIEFKEEAAQKKLFACHTVLLRVCGIMTKKPKYQQELTELVEGGRGASRDICLIRCVFFGVYNAPYEFLIEKNEIIV